MESPFWSFAQVQYEQLQHESYGSVSAYNQVLLEMFQRTYPGVEGIATQPYATDRGFLLEFHPVHVIVTYHGQDYWGVTWGGYTEYFYGKQGVGRLYEACRMVTAPARRGGK